MAIESVEELVAVLRRHPEWRDELRRVVLTEELLGLPEIVRQLAERVDALTQRVDALTQRVDALTQTVASLALAQERTELRMHRLVEHVDEVAIRADEALGYVIEQRYRERASAYFQPLARRVRVLTSDELDDLLEDAVERGTLVEHQAQQIRLADAVVRGRDRESGDELRMVLEASRIVDEYDVERAEHRAELLGRLGVPTLAVVGGREVLDRAAEQARAKGVWLLRDGQVEPPPAAA